MVVECLLLLLLGPVFRSSAISVPSLGPTIPEGSGTTVGGPIHR